MEMTQLLSVLIITIWVFSKADGQLLDCSITQDLTNCENVKFDEKKPLNILKFTSNLELSTNNKKLPPGAFVLVSTITKLTISRSPLEEISAHTFDNLEQLKHLTIYWNQIKELPPSIFGRCCSQLETLNFGGNIVEYVDGDVFRPLRQLRTLNLTWNLLTVVPVLDSLYDLKILDLYNNRIMKLDRGAFKGLHNLEFLNLKGNGIRHIAANAFAGLVKLRYLNIEKNELSIINVTNIRDNLERVEEIRLRVNPLPCTLLKSVIVELLKHDISVPEGLAEPGDISYHGIFCIFDRYDELEKNKNDQNLNNTL